MSVFSFSKKNTLSKFVLVEDVNSLVEATRKYHENWALPIYNDSTVNNLWLSDEIMAKHLRYTEKHDTGSFWNTTETIVYTRRGLLTICTLFSSSWGIEKEGRLLCPIGQAPAWKRSKVIPSYHWCYDQREPFKKIWKNNLTNNTDIKSIRKQMFISAIIYLWPIPLPQTIKIASGYIWYIKVKPINLSKPIRLWSDLWLSTFSSR